jgi:S1-C subfamily serine protease
VGSWNRQVMTTKDIFIKNRGAVVQIHVNGSFSGTGFFISPLGIIATAAHVVTSQEKQFAPDTKAYVPQTGAILGVTPYQPITDESIVRDTVLLKANGTEFPTAEIGRFDQVEETDALTIIGSIYGLGKQTVFSGIVSGMAVSTDSKSNNVILFQMPVRGGFSGSPIFDSHGRAVGIVTTKVFGISPALMTMRSQLKSTSATIHFGSVDVGQSLLELTNVLDQNLISGMGTAVSIEYAVAMLEAK